MKNKRITLAKILGNNKIAFVISVVIAVTLWAVVAVFFSEQQVNIISDVPINIDTEIAEKLGLQVFGKTDYTVSVKVTGKRYEVSSAAISKEDFVATVSTASVSSTGKYTLPVSVSLANQRSDIDIVSWTNDTIDVFFDYMLSETYVIEPSITAETAIAADGFVNEDPILSIATVTISGAASEIEKIHKVIAKVSIEEPLKETKIFQTSVLPINENNGAVRSAYITIDAGVSDISVTVPVFKVTKIVPSVKFKNTPSYFIGNPIKCTYEPGNQINAAIAAELDSNSQSLPIGTIDFSQIKVGHNSFSFKTDDIANVRVLDDIEKIDVSFYISEEFKEYSYNIDADNLSVAGQSDGVDLSIPEDFNLPVTVIGLPEELATLTPSSIKATIDVTGIVAGSGVQDVPLTFTVENVTGCWVYGTYTMKIEV